MLLEEGYNVIGVDNLNDYYDKRLKLWRLESLKKVIALNFTRLILRIMMI